MTSLLWSNGLPASFLTRPISLFPILKSFFCLYSLCRHASHLLQKSTFSTGSRTEAHQQHLSSRVFPIIHHDTFYLNAKLYSNSLYNKPYFDYFYTNKFVSASHLIFPYWTAEPTGGKYVSHEWTHTESECHIFLTIYKVLIRRKESGWITW